MSELENSNMIWSSRPPAWSWDPAASLSWHFAAGREDRFVPLDSLLREFRQGVFSAGVGSGNITVQAMRVADIHPMIPGTGEMCYVTATTLDRHILKPGDVLVARVGRHGQACCVSADTVPMIAREGIFVLRPMRPEWGPAIAAALCSRATKSWLLGRGRGGLTLTRDDLADIPVPVPKRFDFGTVAGLMAEAGSLAKQGYEILDAIRGAIGRLLEGMPTGVPHRHLWIHDPGVLDGWCWRDVERYWLRDRAQWQVRGLQPFQTVLDLKASQAKTVVAGSQAPVLESDDVRPDWYLALPKALPTDGDYSSRPAGSMAVNRFYAIRRQSLLIRSAGDVVTQPVVISDDTLDQIGGLLLVPIHWLPLQGLHTPRLLAVILDHPFVRLQRHLGSAFSTIPHLTRGDIAELLIPVLPDAKAQEWEEELHHAQSLFIEADRGAKQAIAIAEEWYQ